MLENIFCNNPSMLNAKNTHISGTKHNDEGDVRTKYVKRTAYQLFLICGAMAVP